MKRSLLVLALGLAAVASAVDPLPRKGALGAQMAPEPSGGMKVVSILPGLSAEGALRVGDVLLALDGTKIGSAADIGGVFGRHRAGDKLAASVLREGQTTDVTLTVKERPRDSGDGYTVEYTQVVSMGARLRVLISRPKGVSGKLPALFMVQGIGAASMDFPISTAGHTYAEVLKAFNDAGWATVRVEKPGLGDSEGKPFTEIDYEHDLDAFRQTLKTLGDREGIDASRVVLFGHSMGGQHAPLLAPDFPFAGIAVYGTGYRSWPEYFLQNYRLQGARGGADSASLARQAQSFMIAYYHLIVEGLSPAEAKTKYPQHASAIDGFAPDGASISGMPVAFWRQCMMVNAPEAWQKVNVPTLVMWGASEFIAYREDHELIVTDLNKRKAGLAELAIIDRADHAFRDVADAAESQRRWGQGGHTLQKAVFAKLLEWAQAVAGPKPQR